MQRRSIAALMISLLLLSACGHGAGERSFQTFRDTLTGSLVTVTAQVRADYGDTVADYTLTCRELADGYDLTVIAPETAEGVGAHLRRGESTLTFDDILLPAGDLNAAGLTPLTALPYARSCRWMNTRACTARWNNGIWNKEVRTMNRKIRTWVEISLNDLEHNYREISSRLPDGCQMLGVCKANAYGHGAVRVAQRLQRAGCQWIAVNCYDEAEELRAAGVTMNILLLGPQSANIAVDLATLGVTQAVGSIEYARELNRFLAGTGLRLNAHMKLETGMGRTGFDVHDDSHLDEMLEALSLPHLNFTGVFTHFAVSDENGDPYTQLQFSRFLHAIDRMEQASGHHFAIRHCANSGAVINYPQMHLDMVRPGLLLYGVFPAAETGGLDLRPAMSLYSRVSEVTHHHAGDTISYGRTFTCPHDMRLAVLPVGYADGLLRSLSGKGDVLLHGKRAPQVGRICMDMCMVDVTDIPEVQPGDVATIFGADLSVAEQAEKAGTIPYELLCAMSQRVQRVYID